MIDKNPNQFRRRSLAVFFLIILVVVVLEVGTELPLFPWDILLVVVAGVIWGVLFFQFWRCPYCGKSLPKGDGDLAFCPHCGQALPTMPWTIRQTPLRSTPTQKKLWPGRWMIWSL